MNTKLIIIDIDNEGRGIVSREMVFERLCPTCNVQLDYKGIVAAHLGGRGFEIAGFIGSIFLGFPLMAIRDLMVKRTAFNSYICPLCHYTTLVMEEDDSSTTTDRTIKYNEYREYKKKLENVSQLFSEVKRFCSI